MKHLYKHILPLFILCAFFFGCSTRPNELKRVQYAYSLLPGFLPTLRERHPDLKEKGENPFTLDSSDPTGNFREFLMGEVRYASLQKLFPDKAEELFAKTEKDAKERLAGYKKLAGKE